MQYGPKIVTDGLVLCLDAAEVNSYAGEPTTNNLDSSDRANANTGPNVSNNFASIAMTKEVVNYSSDRPHVYRFKSTNATGYVSIGYNSSIQNQSGSVYAFSFDYKVIRADSGTTTNLNTANTTVYGNGYKNPATGTTASNLTSSEVELSDGWKRVTKTYTCGYTGYNQTRQDLNTGDTGDFEVLIDNIQFEDKTYSTPFADLSRSATNGWVDRSGNSNNGTLTNMIGTEASHYRDGQVIMPVANSYLDFDGSNDQVLISSLGSSYSNYSLEFWIAQTGASDSSRFYSWNAGGTFTVRYRTSPKRFDFHYNPLDGSPPSTSVSGVTLSDTVNGIWHHVVITNNSSVGAIVYTDGVAGSTGEAAVAMGNYGHILGTGYAGIVPTKCKIASFKIYNKALTAAEVLSNYNATKGRF